jgi:hypothetical protein
MITHRILTLPEANGLPVVPGAEFITPGGIMDARGKRIDAPDPTRSRWTHEMLGLLVKIAPGVYHVWSDRFDLVDPGNAGKTLAEYLATDRSKLKVWEVTGKALDPMSGKQVTVTRTVELQTVPAQDPTVAKPWVVQGITVTEAANVKPTIKSVISGYGMKAALTAAEVPIGERETLIP